MVDFWGRNPYQERYSMEERGENDRIVIDQRLEPVSMAVEAFIVSGESPEFDGHKVDSEITFDGDRVSKRVMSISQEQGGGLLSDPSPADLIQDEFKVNMEQDGDKTVVTFEGGLIETDGVTTDGTANEEEMKEAIARFLRTERKRAMLGYGPQHPLDEIEPTSIERGSSFNSHDEVLDTFSDWVEAIIEPTREEKTEYAFFNDFMYNTVGVIEGTVSSVRFPHTDISGLNVSGHCHPSLDSFPVPSTTDISTAVSQKNNSWFMVARGHYTPHLAGSEEEQREFEEKYGNSMPVNTASRIPTTVVRSVDSSLVKDIDDYIEEYFDIVEEIVSKTERIAMEQAESHVGHIDNDVEDVMKDTISSNAEALLDGHRDRAEPILRKSVNKWDTALVPKFRVAGGR